VCPLWSTYVGKKGRTLGKTYGIEVRCYWEHPWGTHWGPKEHIENLMGTHWKLERNMLGTKEKWKKSSFPPTQNFKKNKNHGTLSASGAFPLATWNFYFQNYSSSFLAWANTPIIYLLSIEGTFCHSHAKLSTICRSLGETPLCYFKALLSSKISRRVCGVFLVRSWCHGNYNIRRSLSKFCCTPCLSCRWRHFSQGITPKTSISLKFKDHNDSKLTKMNELT
jgi:hypothetical protein